MTIGFAQKTNERTFRWALFQPFIQLDAIFICSQRPFVIEESAFWHCCSAADDLQYKKSCWRNFESQKDNLDSKNWTEAKLLLFLLI